MVQDVADLYTLKQEDLLSLEGFAEKKGDNLLAAIDASRNQSLARLITALGIHGVGEVMAADLARYYTDLEQLSQASFEGLQSIEGDRPEYRPGHRGLVCAPGQPDRVGKAALRWRMAAQRKPPGSWQPTAFGWQNLCRYRDPAQLHPPGGEGIYPVFGRKGDQFSESRRRITW